MLPEERDDYDYYAIDISSRPEVIRFVTNARSLVPNTTQSFCSQFFHVTLNFVEYPPCDPASNKLRQVCESDCQRFTDILSGCLDNVIEAGNTILGFAALHDIYNCSDPSTYFPNASLSLYDSQQSCYTVSFYNMGKCLLAV